MKSEYTEACSLNRCRMLKRVYDVKSGIELFLQMERKPFPSVVWSDWTGHSLSFEANVLLGWLLQTLFRRAGWYVGSASWSCTTNEQSFRKHSCLWTVLLQMGVIKRKSWNRFRNERWETCLQGAAQIRTNERMNEWMNEWIRVGRRLPVLDHTNSGLFCVLLVLPRLGQI
jgi:hypothetical protein